MILFYLIYEILRYIPRKISMATDPVAGPIGGLVAELFRV